MADRYYRAALGAETKEEVVEAATSSLVWCEFACTYTLSGNSKLDALKALRAIEQYIIADAWPPNT